MPEHEPTFLVCHDMNQICSVQIHLGATHSFAEDKIPLKPTKPIAFQLITRFKGRLFSV